MKLLLDFESQRAISSPGHLFKRPPGYSFFFSQDSHSVEIVSHKLVKEEKKERERRAEGGEGVKRGLDTQTSSIIRPKRAKEP